MREARCGVQHRPPTPPHKIKVAGKGGYHYLRTKKHKRFDVSQHTGRDETGRQLYRELVYRRTTEAWVNEGSVEEKWSATQSGLVKLWVMKHDGNLTGLETVQTFWSHFFNKATYCMRKGLAVVE